MINKNTIIKKHILLLLLAFFIIFYFVNNIYSQNLKKNIFSNKNEKLEFNFYILESQYNEGAYIKNDIWGAGFKKFDRQYLPQNKKLEKRMYTLRSIFYLNNSLKTEDLALYIGPMYYAFNVYINEKLIYKRGMYKETFNSGIHDVSKIYLSKDMLFYDEKKNEIAIELFTESNKNTPIDEIFISSYRKVSTQTFWRNLIKINIGSQGSLIISLFVGLFFLFNFFTRKNKDKRYLFFTLMCLFHSMQAINSSFAHDAANELMLEKLSRISFPFTMSFLFLFMTEFTKILNKQIWLKILIVLPSIVSAIIIICLKKLIEVSALFGKMTLFFILPLLLLNLPLLIISVVKYKNKTSIPLLISFLVAIGTSIYDMYYYNLNLSPYAWISGYGFMALVVSIFFVLAGEQSKLYLESLKRTKELKKLNELKDEFLSNTSYELRTPLNGIIGITESLIAGATGKLSGNTIANLSIVITSGKRLFYLINDILDYSKLKYSDIKLIKRPIDIKQIAKIVITLCKPLLKGKNIGILSNISDDIPFIYGDENRLQQIMYNLIGNAIKFTENGMIKVSAIKKNNFIEVQISDTGIGIPREEQKNIFKSFQQIEEDIEMEYAGVGLGLSITKKLIELHQGTIRVESIVGKGSIFSFSLPIAMEKNYITRVSPSDKLIEELSLLVDIDNIDYDEISVSTNQNEILANVLVVDDEPTNRQVLINQLGLAGYNVQTASDGYKALKILEDGYIPDIILLDVMMPKISGYEVCRKLRIKYSPIELPILILTAKAHITDIVAGLEAGANDYLPKPFDRKELLARVNTLIKLKKATMELNKFNVELEEKIKERTTQLEQANEELKAFSYRVSHDLRSPIAIIENCRYLIMNNKDQKLSDTTKEYIENIGKNTKRMINLIDNLFTLSTVLDGKVNREKFNLSEMVEDISEELKLLDPNRKVEFMIEKNVFINGDEHFIKIVMDNLIGNAWKFTKKCDVGKIKFGIIKNDGTSFRENNVEDEIIYFVRDNGIGFDMKYSDKIFRCFERIYSGPEFKGNGIGLSMVQRIIHYHNGKIWVISEKGKGTIFYFTIIE